MPLRVCYLGVSSPAFSRNGTFIPALRAAGAIVHECFDSASGLRRFRNIARMHRALRGEYDVLVVGFPGQTVTWFARLIARRGVPVVLDACSSLYEANILSREPGMRWSFYALKNWLWDFFGCRLAHAVLVESESQVRYFRRLRLVGGAPCVAVYTGTDEAVFRPRPEVAKRPDFTVIFRGRLMAEAGVRHAVDAAALLANEGVRLLVMGRGNLLGDVTEQVARLGLSNVEIDSTDYPSAESLALAMARCHVSLGQLEAHVRLERTIPHKAYESMAVGVPYVTARATAIGEVLDDGVSAIFVPPADPAAIASAVRRLRDEPSLGVRLAAAARSSYDLRAGRAATGSKMLAFLETLVSGGRS